MNHHISTYKETPLTCYHASLLPRHPSQRCTTSSTTRCSARPFYFWLLSKIIRRRIHDILLQNSSRKNPRRPTSRRRGKQYFPTPPQTLLYVVIVLILDYVGHVYARTEGVVGVLISDKDYPLRVAYSLLSKILDEFLQRYPPSKFKSSASLDFPELNSVVPLSVCKADDSI